MTNLKTTIKTLSIAAAVSFSMNAMATTFDTIPGMPAGFTYDKPTAVSTGTGVDAIGNMNTILTSLATTGGTSIDTNTYWKSFIGDSSQAYFDYDAAKPMIADLIYAVTGEEFDTGTSTWSKDTNTVNGLANANGVEFGDLDNTGQNALTLMSSLGFTHGTGTFGSVDSSGTTTNFDANSRFSDPTHLELQATVLGDTAANWSTKVSDAALNETAYNTANDLIKSIAAQRKTGTIVDVAAAATALQDVINHHNGFLGASISEKAKGLKEVIRNIGYQVAAVNLGKGTALACDGQDQANNRFTAGCTAIGDKFVAIGGKVQAGGASNYSLTLTALDTYATHLINFNTSEVTNFSANDTTLAINDQFGVIDAGTEVKTLESDWANAVEDSNIDGFSNEFGIGNLN